MLLDDFFILTGFLLGGHAGKPGFSDGQARLFSRRWLMVKKERPTLIYLQKKDKNAPTSSFFSGFYPESALFFHFFCFIFMDLRL